MSNRAKLQGVQRKQLPTLPGTLVQPRAFLLLCLLALLGLAGCKGNSLPPLVPVKGKVTVDGQPLTSGQVTYLPADPSEKAPLSNGTIDSAGNYEIFTQGQSGAPKGKYKVTVSPSMVPAPGATAPPKAPFHPKFMEFSKTTLLVEVVEGANPDAYWLKLTK